MPFLAAHCISSWKPIQQKKKRHLGRASARRGKPPLNNMGALSTPGVQRATEEQGIKTKRHHVQVKVRGQAERKYRVVTAYLHVHWFNSRARIYSSMVKLHQ